MLIIGLALIIFGVVAFKIAGYHEWCAPAWITTAIIAIIAGPLLFIWGGLAAINATYWAYPDMTAFYELNAGNYRVVVEQQNEIATINLNVATDGEVFDGSDFAQSRETSTRYQEYRDAVNDYNSGLAHYKCQGGTFLFWPMGKPPAELKPIAIE